jgi:hypothetical protein
MILDVVPKSVPKEVISDVRDAGAKYKTPAKQMVREEGVEPSRGLPTRS